MIHAEISVYPMATKTTSVSFYIAKAIESIQQQDDLKYQINPMGTVLEAPDIDVIYKATKKMLETIHNLGVSRVGLLIKIDSRQDKMHTMDDKINAVKMHMTNTKSPTINHKKC